MNNMRKADSYWCPWCNKGFLVIQGEEPQGHTVLNVKCPNIKCGKPYQIQFPGGKIIKSKPIPNKDLVA